MGSVTIRPQGQALRLAGATNAPDAGPDPDLAKLVSDAEKATTVAQLRAVVAALIERT